MSNYLLVTYESNWADEIDISGRQLFTKKDWEIVCNDVKNIFEKTNSLIHYIGTHEEIEYRSYKQWICCYTVEELTQTEYIILKKYQKYSDTHYFFEPEYCEEDYED